MTLDASFYQAAYALLRALGAPPGAQNVNLLAAWADAETKTDAKTNAWAWNNPWSTTRTCCGCVPAPGNPDGVCMYPTRADGIHATVLTLENGYYPHILAGLLQNDAALAFSDPAEWNTWGTSLDSVVSVYRTLGVPPGLPQGHRPSPSAAGVAGLVAGGLTVAALVAGAVLLDENAPPAWRARWDAWRERVRAGLYPR